MRNNYFLRWTQRMMFLFTLLCGLSMAAQSSFSISFPAFSAAPTTNPRNLVVCNNQSKLQVQLDVTTASTTGASVTIQLGAGVEYVPGSVAVVSTDAGLTIVDDGGTPNAPKFKVGPNALALANRLVFTIDRKATCATRTAALAGTAFKDTVTGSITGATATTEVSSTYSVTYPVFSFSQPATQTNAMLNTNYTRTFTISNGGNGGATEVYFSIDYPSNGIQNVSVALTGGTGSTGTPLTLTPVSTSGTTAYYTIPTANLTAGSLDFGETLTLTEVYKIKTCNASTNYTAGWGCDAVAANWCQTVTGTGGTSMVAGVPNFDASSFTVAKIGYVNDCTPYAFKFTFKNNGSGNANAAAFYNAVFRIGSSSSTVMAAFDFSAVNVTSLKINGVSVPYTGGTTVSILTLNVKDTFTTDPDGAGVGLDDLDGDGFYDDLPSGATLTVDAVANVNCGAYSCINSGTKSLYFGFVGDVQYTTMCSSTVTTSQARRDTHWSTGQTTLASTFMGEIVSLQDTSYAPANITGGTPFRMRFSIGAYAATPINFNPNQKFVYEVTLPAGLSVSGTGNLKWTNGFSVNNTVYVAGATYTQSGSVLTIVSPGTSQGIAYIDLVYTCGTSGPMTIPYKFKYINDYVSGCTCNSDWFCGSYTIGNAICPTPCPTGGPSVSSVKTERDNDSLGWTDNTLSTHQVKSSISAYDLSKALPLDNISITANGVQNTIPSANLFLKVVVKKLAGANADKLTPNSVDVVIKRASTTIASANVTSFANTGTTATKQFIVWDLTSVVTTAGGLLPGDVIETISHYTVSGSNTDYPSKDVQTGDTLYLFNKDGSGNELSCTSVVPEMYLVGFSQEFFRGSTSQTTSCNDNQAIVYTANRFAASGAKYVSEIRPGFQMSSFEVTVPAGYEMVGVKNMNNVMAPTGYLTPTSITGNLYHYDLAPWTEDINIVNAYNSNFYCYFKPTCDTPANSTFSVKIDGQAKYYHYKDLGSPNAGTGTLFSSTNETMSYLASTKPAITLSNQTNTVQATRPTESFTVRMTSTGTATAPYTWLAVPTVSGVTINQIVDVATNTAVPLLTYSGGVWAQLSTTGLASAATHDYRIDFSYTVCDPTNIVVKGGWNCASYPTDPSAYTCGTSDVSLPFIPQTAEVQIITVTQPTSDINLCTNLNYEYRINSAGAGNAVDDTFTIDLPAGMSIVAGSLQAQYPVGTGSWETVSTSTAGTQTTLDLTTHTAYPAQGLPGTLTDGGVANSRLMGIRFNVVTDCNFIAGSNLTLSAGANRSCGAPATGDGVGSASLSVKVSGADVGYVISNSLTPTSGSFSNCDSPIVYGSVQTVILSTASDTSATAKAQIVLPVGYDYVVGSFVCNSTPLCPTFTGTTTDPASGAKIMNLNIPAGMTTGQALNYGFAIQPTTFIACGDYKVTFTTFDEVTGLSCPTAPGGVCSKVIVQTGKTTYTYNVVKPELQITNLNGTYGSGSYSGSITVNNTGAINQTNSSPANPVKVDFYCADASGNPTGTKITTITLAGPVAAGASVTENYTVTSSACATGKLVAVIATSSNCICAPSQKVMDVLPVATNDTVAYTAGSTTSPINVLSNDTTGDTIVPSTVSLVAPSGATGVVTDAHGDITSMTIPGEGTWSVDPTTGAITFTPVSGFTGTPTPIQYNGEDAEGNTSNNATLTLDLLPIATNDAQCYTASTSAVTINVLSNDTTGDVIVPSRVSLVAPGSATGVTTDAQGDVTGFSISGEGTWAVNNSGQVIFTPASATVVAPTVVSYHGYDAEGNASNNATITLTGASVPTNTTNPASACTPATVTATASVPSGQTVVWYDAATGGNVVSSPTLSVAGTVTYYAEGHNGTCVSNTRTAVTLTLTQAPNAGTLSGSQTICVGGTTTFTSNGNTGGVWTSSNSGIASVDASTGVITGLAVGTATITYTVTGTAPCSNVTATRTVTVSAAPNAGTISGTQTVCVGNTTAFTTTGTGGTWSSSDTAVATVDNAGVVTGVAAGTATISYTVPAAGTCPAASSTRTVTVSAAPSAGTLSGTQAICVGGTTTFSSTVSGGTWTSSNTGVASVDSATGLINGLTAGTATITYTVPGTGGCANATATRTVTVTAAPNAGTISGTNAICSTGTTQLTTTGTGGTWSITPTSVATISGTGLVSGVAAGTATVTYTVVGTGGCANATATYTITVTAAPSAGTLSGTQAICVGGTTTFSSTVSGGTWTSSNTGVASVDANTGLINGLTAGTATITYTVPGTGGCANATATRTVTVTAAPNAGTISGTNAICSTGTTQLTTTGTGGTWSITPTSVATINATTGLVSGVAAGTATVTYTVTGTGGCANATATYTVTVTAAPNAGTLAGNQAICVGQTTTFTSNGNTGGTWSSSNTTVATVDSVSGIINGLAAGTATISYTVKGTGGCADAVATRTVTVTAAPNAGTISGTNAICSTGTTQLTTTGTGGTWSITPTSVATISTSGLVTGQTAGTATVTYTVTGTGGCSNATATYTITVTAAPNAGTISGNQAICVGQTTTFTTTGTSGNWSSSNTTVATVDSATGVITGQTAGTATISYTVKGTGGCADAVATRTVTVTAAPNAGTISGTQNICVGNTTQLSTTSTGGTWSIAPAATASITNAGLVTGSAAGTATVTYTVVGTGGCANATATYTINVYATPNAGTLSGTQAICVGQTTPFTTTGTGGTWSSSNAIIAVVDSITGTVTGQSAGTATIIYTVPANAGCPASTATRTVTVTAAPNAGTISGTNAICSTGTTQLTTTGTGGTWSITPTSVANISTSGLVTGQTAGTATVTYTVVGTGGCANATSTYTVTVTAAPNAGTLAGNQAICVGQTTTFTSNGNTGGTWSSSNTTVATVDTAAGTIYGLAAGTATISYTVKGTGGCADAVATRTVTVTAAPVAGTISGTQAICVGGTTQLSSTSAGGAWTIAPAATATISTTGLVTGSAAGTATVTYTVTGTGGCANATATYTVTVTAAPNAGVVSTTNSTVCKTKTAQYVSTVSGGTWSSSNVTVATVDTNGVVTAVSNGTANIIYTVTGTGGCANAVASAPITVVNCAPDAVNDTVSLPIPEDGANGVVNILANDTDPNGNPTVSSGHTVDLDPSTPGIQTTVTNAQGVWTYNPTTGEVTFDPANNFNGTATLTYQLCDAGTPVLCDTAVITFTVSPVNDAPVLTNDTATTLEDNPVSGDITGAGDTDPDGTPLTVTTTPVSGPSHGTIVINPDGTYTYTPAPNWCGTDVVEIQVCDAGTPGVACTTETLTITVTCVNDTPVVVNDTNTTNEDTPVSGDITNVLDYDPDGTTLVVNTTPVSGPLHGTIVVQPDGTYVYTPNANYCGTDVITLSVCDTGSPLPALCVNQTLTITVTCENDAPVANDDTATVTEDGSVSIPVLSNDNDTADSGTLNPGSVTVTNNPLHGTVTVNPTTGAITYVPAANFCGVDTFTYQVCDNGTPLPALCDTATVTVNVTCVNDAPVSVNDVVTAPLTEDGANGVVNILANDTDPDGNPTPTSGHTVDLDPSTPGVQTTITTTEGVWTYNPTTGELMFDPANNFCGSASLPYTLCDSDGLCSAPATVTFTVTCVNDAPVAVNDTVTTPSETPIVIPVGANDSDVDSALNPCSIDLDPNSAGQQTSFTVAGEGTYTLNASCQVVFTPVGSILGFTSCITYTISDVEGLASNAATICVTVGACVDNPTLDCDGDGVNNATEQTDGTDPLDPCSFNLAHATVAPSAEWLASDCDGDGVTNGQEIADGTNPLVGCDAVEEHVTVAQSAAFLNGDCDGDGLTNGVEIGPDPTHPSDIDNDGTPDYLEPNAGNPSAEDGIEIFNAVTPNGDGDNDVLVIRGIENYPNNTLEVYNRWGVKVYDTTGYGSNGNYFEGISYGRETIQQASELPTGTYYYVLKYVNASGITKERAGYLYINR